MSDGGKKFDSEKVRMDLLSPKALTEIARVMSYGAQKYGAQNWRKGIAWSRVYAAVQRHLLAWQDGETEDPETKISHLAHASCGLMFLLEYAQTHGELDDRFKPEDKEKPFESQKEVDDITRAARVHAVQPVPIGQTAHRDPMPGLWMDSSKLVRP